MINLMMSIFYNEGLFRNIVVRLTMAGVLVLLIVGFVPRKQWRRLKRWLKKHHIKWRVVNRYHHVDPPDDIVFPFPPGRIPPGVIPIPKQPVE